MTKKDQEYKDLSEEIYYLLITNKGKDKGVEEDKLKVLILGKIISMRAADIVWKYLGHDEQQIEEGIEKHGLEDKNMKSSDSTKQKVYVDEPEKPIVFGPERPPEKKEKESKKEEKKSEKK